MSMKKILLILAVLGVAMNAFSQEEVPGRKHSVTTNSFWANWFVQGAVTWNAWYAVGEHSLSAPFRKFPKGEGYTGLGMSFSLGKWFTPGVGLRTKINTWQMGTSHNGFKPDKYWTANEQVMLNLTNLLMGYREKRLWNVIPYVGAGVHRNMTQRKYSAALSLGLLNTFRISRKFAANLEFGWNSYEGSGLSIKQRPQQFTLEVGVTYRIGKSGWSKSPDLEAMNALTQSELDALNAQLADTQAENARLMQELENSRQKTYRAPEPVQEKTAAVVTQKVVTAPVSVFFNLGKAVVMGARDKENVASVARVAKENGLRVVVTGYADSKTGSAESNKRLSQKRADAVADELVRLGVSRDKIETIAAGGVSTLKATENNRRVVIELK